MYLQGLSGKSSTFSYQILKCIIWQRQYEHSDWLMPSHATRVLPYSPVIPDPYCSLTTRSLF